MYPDNWRVRLTTGVVSLTCMAAAMLLGPVVGINAHEFWPLMLLLVVAMIVGNVLGPLVCRLLFRPPSGEPPDHPPRA
jgi:hypothetical protein